MQSDLSLLFLPEFLHKAGSYIQKGITYKISDFTTNDEFKNVLSNNLTVNEKEMPTSHNIRHKYGLDWSMQKS